MERYAPTMKDLASRDVVSRSIYQEVAAGRGVNGQDFVHLDVRHLGRGPRPQAAGHGRLHPDLLRPRAAERTWCRSSPPRTTPWADPDRRRRPGPGRRRWRAGRTASTPAGECACVSVHGANRLGTNSLLDILVFGRRAGMAMTDALGTPRRRPATWRRRPRRGRSSPTCWPTAGGERPATLRAELREMMFRDCGRVPLGRLASAGSAVADLRDRARRPPTRRPRPPVQHRPDRCPRAGFLLDCAEAMVISPRPGPRAAEPTPVRTIPSATTRPGCAHVGDTAADGTVDLTYKPVTVTEFAPAPRVLTDAGRTPIRASTRKPIRAPLGDVRPSRPIQPTASSTSSTR